jgi:hypothetical protein
LGDASSNFDHIRLASRGNVRFAPNSDIDCVRRHIRFAAKGDLRTAVRCAEDHDNVGSPDDRAGLKPAITLSRKDWPLSKAASSLRTRK